MQSIHFRSRVGRGRRNATRMALLIVCAVALPIEAYAMATGLTTMPTSGLFIELYTMVRGILGGFLGLSAAAVCGSVGVWSMAAGGKFVQGLSFLALAVVTGFAPNLLEKLYLLTPMVGA
ncbi:MAG: hypothetical protein KF778_15735 [Rhodocyclaceae bacterium]|nr:hypothetical protein [Rhodocyclaceae bacterium]MBX3669853.1 hypothetical protein [Rhodocyclaceae bacterium]